MMSGVLDEWMEANRSHSSSAEALLCEALIKQALDDLLDKRYLLATLGWILDDSEDFEEVGVIPFNVACALAGVVPAALRQHVVRSIAGAAPAALRPHVMRSIMVNTSRPLRRVKHRAGRVKQLRG